MPKMPPTHSQLLKQANPQATPEGRPTAAQRGYNYEWQKYRKVSLAQHPLCVHCQQAGRVTAATIVDHIIPHRGDRHLFWSPTNHQPLCSVHHNRKTAAGG